MEYANDFVKDDDLVDIVKGFYKVIPGELSLTAKIQNPWPNVDAGSGALLQHFGLKEFDYYTVLFGVSRAFGTMASQIWSRALGFPIERPNSITMDGLVELALQKQGQETKNNNK